MKHLFQAHNSETDFRYACEISSCSRVFVAGDSFDAFRSHCSRYHYNWKAQFVNEDEDTFSEMEVHVSNSVSVVHKDGLEDSSVEGDHPDNGCFGDDVSNTSNCDNIVMNAAHFILNLKEKFKLSQVSLDFVIKSVEELLQLSANTIKQQVLEALLQEGVVISPLLIDDCFTQVTPFGSLKTEYQQTKFYKESFNLIVRLAIDIGLAAYQYFAGTCDYCVRNKT